MVKRSRLFLSVTGSPEATIALASGPRISTSALESPDLAAAASCCAASSGVAKLFCFAPVAAAAGFAAAARAKATARTENSMRLMCVSPRASSAPAAATAARRSRRRAARRAAIAEVAGFSTAADSVERARLSAAAETARAARAISGSVRLSELVAAAAREILPRACVAAAVSFARIDPGPCAAAVSLLGRLVAVLRALAVLRSVLPVAVADVGAVEVVVGVVIDVDVTAAPMAPAPHGRADDDAHREHECRTCDVARRIVVVGRIRRVGPGTVDDHRVIGRHVDHLRIRGLDDVDGRPVLLLDLDRLLLAGLEIPRQIGRAH